MSPRPGDFFVVRTRGFYGWAIRTITQSPVNHAAVLMPDGRLLEARPGGAGWQTVDHYDGCLRAWSDVPLTPQQRELICQRAAMFHGVPYGWADVVALGLARLGVTIPPVVGRLKRRDTAFCSQLVAVAYHAAGVDIVPGGSGAPLSPSFVAPGDLYDVVAGLTL